MFPMKGVVMACSDGSQDFNSFIEEIFIVIYYILFIMVTEEVEVWLEVFHSAGAVNNDETLDHIRRHRGKEMSSHSDLRSKKYVAFWHCCGLHES